jgi:hypothetical protein
MDAYKAYRYYLAIKLHFTTDKFNVFANHGAVKYSRERFNNRNDRYIFDKLSRKFKSDKEYIHFLACNYMYGNPDVVYSGQEAEDNYIEYTRIKQSITKIFSDDTNIILRELEKTNSDLNFTNNQLPIIITLYLSNKIKLESLRILDDRFNLLHNLKMENQTLYKMFDDLFRVVEKSKGFVKYDNTKTNPIIENLIEEIENFKNEQNLQETSI